MSSNTELRRVARGDEASLYRAINVLIDRDRGNLGSQIRLRDYNGKRQLVVGSGGVAAGTALSSNNYAVDMQSPLGFHLACLLAATSPTAAPTAANTALLVKDAATSVGADFLAVGNLQWKSDTAFTMKLDHAATADRTVTFQDLAGTVAELGVQNAGHLLWVDNLYDIGAAGATRPRNLYLAGNLVAGGTITGSVAAAYTDFASTVTISQPAALTKTVAVAHYVVLGKFCHLQVRLDITSAGTAGNAIVVGAIPAAVAPLNTGSPLAQGTFHVFRTGVGFRSGAAYFASSSTVSGVADADGNSLGTVTGGNFALAVGDSVSINLAYETA